MLLTLDDIISASTQTGKDHVLESPRLKIHKTSGSADAGSGDELGLLDTTEDLSEPVPTSSRRSSAPSPSPKPAATKALVSLGNLKGPAVTVTNEVDHAILPQNFEFINGYIFGEGTSPASEDFNHGCNCSGTNACEFVSCECLSDAVKDKSGRSQFPYHETEPNKGCLKSIYLKTRSAIYECNEKCNCGADCRSRVVQRGRQVALEIFRTEDRGWGLRCAVDLRKGQFVDTYTGEVIKEEEVKIREASAGGHHKDNYLFSLDKFRDALPEETQHHVVDGEHMGGPTRFINHSCDPNMVQQTVHINHSDYHVYLLAFFALHDIPANTELTFNYSAGEDATPISDKQARRRQKETGQAPQRCLCGANNCRRYLW